MEEALSQHADAVYRALGDGLAPEVGARRRMIAERLFKCLARQNAGALAEFNGTDRNSVRRQRRDKFLAIGRGLE